MDINLPNHIDVHQKAAAAGFGDDIEAYVSHLIETDEPALLSESELEESLAMIRRGEADIAAGRTRPFREALEDIAKKNGLTINK